MKNRVYLFGIGIVAVLFLSSAGYSVTSKIVYQKSAADFSGGKKDNVVINSRGVLQLAGATRLLSKDFDDAWAADTMVCADDGAIYLGTSPDGEIFRYKDGKTEKIYPQQKSKKAGTAGTGEEHLTNKHIFKMIIDADGRLIAGVSGQDCRLIRYDGKSFKVIFEPQDANYIFAMTLDAAGNLYIGTGPNGKLYRLERKTDKAELIYDCQDKNILCLRTDADGFVYAGTDTRGVVYKINPKDKSATILYDSPENEISDLIFDSQGNLYAAATSYKAIKAQLATNGHIAAAAPGKPELSVPASKPHVSEAVKTIRIANDDNVGDKDKDKISSLPAAMKRATPGSAESVVYRITKKGFVDKVFSQVAVLFCLDWRRGQLLLGTGNNARLYKIDPAGETQTLIYEDKTASQITDIKTIGKTGYFCTANPPKLIELSDSFARQGVFTSSLIDAAQPAGWGKFQIDADIPKDTKIMVSARTGNTEDVNDPTYSPWTKPVKISKPVELKVPSGRFYQYRLRLCGNGRKTPVVRQTAVAYVVPNLAPKVTEVEAAPLSSKNSAMLKITFDAEDRNNDKLVYKIDFRETGRSEWIKLKDDLKKKFFTFDSRTLEDGIYEFRVTASDKLSNTEATKLSGSRISEPVTIDNTAPVIEKYKIKTDKATCIAEFRLHDKLSVIKNLSYTVDSNEDWKSTLPNDGIYDTKTESITVTIPALKPGSHILAVRIKDAAGNTGYRTFEFKLK